MSLASTESGFIEPFDGLDQSFWYVSDFTQSASWLNTAWEADNVTFSGGQMTLELNSLDRDAKDFTGAEIQSNGTYGYGTYTVQMQASGEDGVNSNFFTYTGPYFGNEWNEIDIEILGSDPTQAWLSYHTAEGTYGTVVDLGFDASLSIHEYSFVWEPNAISWYVDGVLVNEVVNPTLAVPDTPSKIYMNIWAGSPEWMGTATFEGSTTAVYDEVDFVAWNGDYTHPLPTSTDLGPLLAVDDAASTSAGTSVLIDVLANDSDAEGDPLSIQLGSAQSAQGGVIAVQDGKVSYTPAAGFTGTDTFVYTAVDSTGESATGTVSVVVEEPTSRDSAGINLFLVDTGASGRTVQIWDGDTIDYSLIAQGKFTFVATAADPASIGSKSTFIFDLSGAMQHSEVDRAAPYAVFGDHRGSLDGQALVEGEYALSIEAYEGKNTHGLPDLAETFHFDIASVDLILG